MTMKQFWVYIMASKEQGTLYTGVTSDLARRVAEHKSGDIQGFTKKYGVTSLVYFEEHGSAESAIIREKQIKKWRRDWKKNLIEQTNPHWQDYALSIGVDSRLRGNDSRGIT